MMQNVKREIQKFADAINGIYIFFASAQHARFHAAAALIVCIAGWYFHISDMEWCLILLCIGFVFFAEAINESIERIADFIHAEQHPNIGKIKDIAAGAVLIAAVCSAIIGAIIFLPKIF